MRGRCVHSEGRLTSSTISGKVVGGENRKIEVREKKASLALKCTAPLSVSLFMSFSVDSEKHEFYLQERPRQTQTFSNWGKGRASLNVIHLDSCACTATTHIKSAC